MTDEATTPSTPKQNPNLWFCLLLALFPPAALLALFSSRTSAVLKAVAVAWLALSWLLLASALIGMLNANSISHMTAGNGATWQGSGPPQSAAQTQEPPAQQVQSAPVTSPASVTAPDSSASVSADNEADAHPTLDQWKPEYTTISEAVATCEKAWRPVVVAMRSENRILIWRKSMLAKTECGKASDDIGAVVYPANLSSIVKSALEATRNDCRTAISERAQVAEAVAGLADKVDMQPSEVAQEITLIRAAETDVVRCKVAHEAAGNAAAKLSKS